MLAALRSMPMKTASELTGPDERLATPSLNPPTMVRRFFITWFSSSTHLKIWIWICRKSSDGVFSHVSPFHNRSEGFGFSDLDLIYRFSDLEDFWDDLPVSRLKYNTPDDFHEVFQTTSTKSSRQLPDDFQEVFQTTSRKSSDEVFFHIKWSPSLSL
ncbi:hypothetical protein Bca4012_043742 [Brassica carinata]